jgi:hypothetical protein
MAERLIQIDVSEWIRLGWEAGDAGLGSVSSLQPPLVLPSRRTRSRASPSFSGKTPGFSQRSKFPFCTGRGNDTGKKNIPIGGGELGWVRFLFFGGGFSLDKIPESRGSLKDSVSIAPFYCETSCRETRG